MIMSPINAKKARPYLNPLKKNGTGRPEFKRKDYRLSKRAREIYG